MPYRRGDRCDITVVMENVNLIFRNFSGTPSEFNAPGDRNFGVVIPDEETADYLESCGYNVKWLKPLEEGDPPTPWMKVRIKYGRIPPHIVMVTSRGHTEMTEETVSILDSVDIVSCDIITRPYEYKEGKISAYVKTLYVTVDEDYLVRKYNAGPADNSAE